MVFGVVVPPRAATLHSCRRRSQPAEIRRSGLTLVPPSAAQRLGLVPCDGGEAVGDQNCRTFAQDNSLSTVAAKAAADRGDPERLCQDDLDHAVTFTEVMPRIDAALRHLFLGRFQEQLAIAAAQEGVALGSRTEDHVLRSLGRVAAKRALILCHMLTIQGREYRQCLPAPAA